ncbi:MAG: AsnC family transcriptional regulator [Rhodobacteraceae bacterium]|nr:AsnC family transcriptional regulator [Paracoccaceae bacterium]
MARDGKSETVDPVGMLGGLDLTPIDRRIIAHLQEDGRRSYVAIAQDVGVTEKTVRAHVRQLIDSQTIQIVALTTPAALGYTVSALAAISIRSPGLGSQVSDALARIDSIDYVVLTYGRFAIFAEIIARDWAELQETIETGIAAIDGIEGIELFPYLSLYYQQANISNFGTAEGVGRGVRDTELSETDKAIAIELSVDGRAAFGTIGDRLGMPESSVRMRVQNMVANSEMRIMAIVNPLKLLNATMAWVAVKVRPGKRLQEVAEALSVMPRVSYVAICAGRFDLFAEVVCDSQRDLMEVIDTHIRPLDGIADTEAFIYANLHYKRLLPLHVRDRAETTLDPVHSFQGRQA